MKFKFNLKLTSFLVSLFLSLLLVILGSKNEYCLSFGFMLMGVSLILFVVYNNDKTKKALSELEQDIDELNNEIESFQSDEDDEIVEESTYVLKQMYLRQSKIKKNAKKSIVTFTICGFALILLGFVSLF